jgi:hypothetical protein
MQPEFSVAAYSDGAPLQERPWPRCRGKIEAAYGQEGEYDEEFVCFVAILRGRRKNK